VICAVLFRDWVAVDATRAPDSKYWCWGPFDPKSDEAPELHLKRSA
jgi:hypothetical protein